MARIRTIKPEFWTSEQVVECSPTARLLFVGLWNFCDDAGRHPASVMRLKMEVFPGDSLSTDTICDLVAELEYAGLIFEYESEGKSYWQVTGWHHQKIDKPNIKYPDPNSTTSRRTVDDSSPNGSRTVDDSSPPEGSLRESKGRERHTASPGGDGVKDRFASFWDLYPRKVGKQAASKAFKRLKPDERNRAVEAVEDYAASRLVAESDRDLIPHPATWLNQGRYDDDRDEWKRPMTRNGVRDAPVRPEQTRVKDELRDAEIRRGKIYKALQKRLKRAPTEEEIEQHMGSRA